MRDKQGTTLVDYTTKNHKTKSNKCTRSSHKEVKVHIPDGTSERDKGLSVFVWPTADNETVKRPLAHWHAPDDPIFPLAVDRLSAAGQGNKAEFISTSLGKYNPSSSDIHFPHPFLNLISWSLQSIT